MLRMAATARPLIVALLVLVPVLTAWAQGFGVSPIRLDLDRATRNASITVNNDDDKPLGFQVRPMEWIQDAEGKDQYLETRDLIVFPQQFQVPPGKNRIFRVGYRNPAIRTEKAYRVFIEDLPGPASTNPDESSSVVISVQFGVPVFLRPVTIEQRGQLQRFEIVSNKLVGELQNTGTVHIRPTSVKVQGLDERGASVFEQVFDGWYILTGAARRFSAPLPAGACERTRKLMVEAVGEKLALKSEFAQKAGGCVP